MQATIGQVGNVEHENITIGKAGRSRWLGRRLIPGLAMNPVTPAWRRRGAFAYRTQDPGDPLGLSDAWIQDEEAKAV